jgi:hypothetical protein
MMEYMIAVRSPASGWPTKSQFFFLCVAMHKKKYGKVTVMERRPTGPWKVGWEVASWGRMWLVKYAGLFRGPMPLTRLWPKIPLVVRVSLPGSSLTFP